MSGSLGQDKASLESKLAPAKRQSIVPGWLPLAVVGFVTADLVASLTVAPHVFTVEVTVCHTMNKNRLSS